MVLRFEMEVAFKLHSSCCGSKHSPSTLKPKRVLMPLTLVDIVQVLISSNLAEDPETRFATWKSDEGCVSRDL